MERVTETRGLKIMSGRTNSYYVAALSRLRARALPSPVNLRRDKTPWQAVTRFTGSYSLFFLYEGFGASRLAAARLLRPHRTRTMLTHGALHRLAIDRPPVSRAFEFRSLMRAIIPTNRHLYG